MENQRMFIPDDLQSKLAEFEKCYVFGAGHFCVDNRKLLPEKEDRLCRFCGRKMPGTTFEEQSHVFPRSMGNDYFLSGKECDSCNHIFTRYESDLARFIGPTRTLHGATNRSRIATFISPDKSMKAFPTNFFGTEAIKIERNVLDDSTIRIDLEKGETVFRFTKQPYRPQFVFKALLKMALSLLHQDLLSNYTKGLQYLTQPDAAMEKVPPVVLYILPIGHTVTEPYCVFFHSLNDDISIPPLLCMIRLEHFVFHFPVPFSAGWPTEGVTLRKTIPVCPPLDVNEHFRKAMVTGQTLDLSSMELKREELSTLTLQMTTINSHQTMVYDPITGKEEQKPFDPAEITGIVIVHDRNFKLPIK